MSIGTERCGLVAIVGRANVGKRFAVYQGGASSRQLPFIGLWVSGKQILCNHHPE